MIQNMTNHPLADLFPMMDDQAIKELAEDIKANGQKNPIVVWKGQIIDGRNRFKACRMAGDSPVFITREFEDESEVAKFIVSQNIHRRHLSTSQRAAIAAEMATLVNGSNQYKKVGTQNCAPITEPQAASMMNVSERSVQQAKSVKKSSPELFEKVKAGEMSVATAERQLKPNPKVKAILKDPEAKRSFESDGCISTAYQIARDNAKAKDAEESEEVEETEDNGIVEDNEDTPKKIVRYWLPCYVDVESDGNMEKAKAFFERILRTGGIRTSDSNNDELQRFLNAKP